MKRFGAIGDAAVGGDLKGDGDTVIGKIAHHRCVARHAAAMIVVGPDMRSISIIFKTHPKSIGKIESMSKNKAEL